MQETTTWSLGVSYRIRIHTILLSLSSVLSVPGGTGARVFTMPGLLRRLSSRFSGKNKVNGTSLPAVSEAPQAQAQAQPQAQTNGTTNGDQNGAATDTYNVNGTSSIAQAHEKTKDVERQYPSGAANPDTAPEKDHPPEGPPATRKDVEDTFEQFAQLIHASRRPLPSQTGDGAYLEKDEPTGFWSDMKNMGFSDLKTITHLLEDMAVGGPIDDRKMHMEEVMQVGVTMAVLPCPQVPRSQLLS